MENIIYIIIFIVSFTIVLSFLINIVKDNKNVGYNFTYFISKFLSLISKKINKLNSYINRKDIILSKAIYDEKGRFLLYIAENQKLKNNYEFLEILFNSLKADDDFLNFGYQKVIFLFSRPSSSELPLPFHHNVLINNTTTFEEYYSSIENHLNYITDEAHHYIRVDRVPVFEVKVWNFYLKDNKNLITKPIKGYS